MLVKTIARLPQNLICRYPFIHLGGVRLCESKVSCPRTQHSDPDYSLHCRCSWGFKGQEHMTNPLEHLLGRLPRLGLKPGSLDQKGNTLTIIGDHTLNWSGRMMLVFFFLFPLPPLPLFTHPDLYLPN